MRPLRPAPACSPSTRTHPSRCWPPRHQRAWNSRLRPAAQRSAGSACAPRAGSLLVLEHGAGPVSAHSLPIMQGRPQWPLCRHKKYVNNPNTGVKVFLPLPKIQGEPATKKGPQSCTHSRARPAARRPPSPSSSSSAWSRLFMLHSGGCDAHNQLSIACLNHGARQPMGPWEVALGREQRGSAAAGGRT